MFIGQIFISVATVTHYHWAALRSERGRVGENPGNEVGKFFPCQKRQNGGRNFQKALRVPSHRSMRPISRGGDGSLQVVWRTDLEVDLEQTQHYCVELLALYLPRMIVQIQYSMMFLACAGAAETMTMPSHGPHGKSTNLLVKSLSFQERNILFVDRPSNRNRFTWIVRMALNAISDRNKTET